VTGFSSESFVASVSVWICRPDAFGVQVTVNVRLPPAAIVCAVFGDTENCGAPPMVADTWRSALPLFVTTTVSVPGAPTFAEIESVAPPSGVDANSGAGADEPVHCTVNVAGDSSASLLATVSVCTTVVALAGEHVIV
jgi:hypothetical protein